jgi:aerobic carbon-monoxide dehydrogenase small subunit
MKYPVALTVNGRECLREVEARTLLVHFLREELGLTGTRVGCETSVCGACTVLVNGLAVKSCSRLAVQADGAAIVTVEGLAAEARREARALETGLHPLQESFLERHAVQCGYCTSGMLLVARDLLERSTDPGDEEIRRALDGNLCACTGHERIVEAVRQAAAGLRERSPSPPAGGKET